MDRFVDYATAKRGMGEALRSLVVRKSDLGDDVGARLRAAIGTLLTAGAEAGVLRADLSADDILRAMGSVWLIPDEPGWQDQAHRLLTLVLDGLRHRAG